MTETLTPRQKRLLCYVVKEYIDHAEPVGSQQICQKYLSGECSPATIRNELAELENLGYLTHPYTSAGRVPTDKGYRLYVDELMEVYKLTSREKALVDTLQNSLQRDMNNILTETMRTLQAIAQNYATIVKTNNELLAELTKSVNSTVESARKESLYLSGLSRMFYEPEFENIQTVRKTMQALDSQERLIELLDEYSNPHQTTVKIGSENIDKDLDEVSIITRDFFYRDEPVGSIGILGPTRMRYSKMTTAIKKIADVLDNFFSNL